MNQLVARVLRIGKRVQPYVHTRLHMPERQVGAYSADGDKPKAHQQVELLARGHVEHDEEHEEEHERAAEILLEHHDEQGDQPHEQKRQQRADVGQVERACAPREHGEHLAVLGEVSRQKQHDGYLSYLARLEREHAGNADPDATAVDLLPDDRQKRREQQREAHDHERVLVVGHLVQVAEQHEHEHHARHAQEQPHHLVDGDTGLVRIGREPRDERDAYAG